MPLITLANVAKIYRHGNLAVPALSDFSLAIEPGEFTVLAGRPEAARPPCST